MNVNNKQKDLLTADTPAKQYRCKICNYETTAPHKDFHRYGELRCADYYCNGPVELITNTLK